MPRLSLYRPEKSNDFKFIDRTVYEMFQVGGVDVYVHKYIGPGTPTESTADNPRYDRISETNIQDLLFLENRDRKYDPDVYVIRGHYQVSDIDFNLSQFGLFLQNDTIFMTIHINNSIDLVGRKIMPGDVFELPNLKDEYALNDFQSSLKRFYVVEDVNRAAEGFSATWYPHLYRLKLKPIVDSQEFKDILDRPEDEDTFRGDYQSDIVYQIGQTAKFKGDLYECTAETLGVPPPDSRFWRAHAGNNLRDILSTYEAEMQINDAVVAQAEADAPASGYEVGQFFTLNWDQDTGRPAILSVDSADIDTTSGLPSSQLNPTPPKEGYSGYLIGDGIPPGGEQFGFGLQFPRFPSLGDYFLRTDYMPNRLFKYDGARWVKFEDKVRMTLSNTDDRQTHRLSFVNNSKYSGIDKVLTDVVTVDISGNAQFAAGESTLDFQIDELTAFVKTVLDYDDDLAVEAWLNEDAQVPNIVTQNSEGKLAFRINHSLQADTKIRYNVYRRIVQERQAVSKAVRKIRAEADE
jgi:hypothetical protein